MASTVCEVPEECLTVQHPFCAAPPGFRWPQVVCRLSRTSHLPTCETPRKPKSSEPACGVERWEIKTLTDPDAAVNLTPVPTTTAALNALPPRCSGLPDRRIGPEEFQVYEIVGRVILVRLEDDRDYHVVLADVATGDTIVTELADPGCAEVSASPHRALLASAHAQFGNLGRTALTGQLVRLRGVGFYDFDHRQTGRSRSCIELHPAIAVERVLP